MVRTDIEERLKDILVDKLDLNLRHSDIRVDIPLFEGGIGLDSISLVNLIGLIEEEFNFQFADDEITADIFSSLKVLSSFIGGKVVAGMTK